MQGRGLLNLSRAVGQEAESPAPPVLAEKAGRSGLHAAAPIIAPEGRPREAKASRKRFAVAVFFPGTHREYVKRVVFTLRKTGLDREDT